MDVERGARLALMGLAMKVAYMLKRCRLANGTLENKDLVCHRQRVAVIKINSSRGAVFVDQGIDIQLLLIGEVASLDKVLELRDRIDA